MRKKKKKQSIVPLLAIVAALGVALWLLLANVVFVVRGVQVNGAGEILPAATAEAASPVEAVVLPQPASRQANSARTRIRLTNLFIWFSPKS